MERQKKEKRLGPRKLRIRFTPWKKTNTAAVLVLAVGIQNERPLLTRRLIQFTVLSLT